MDEKIKKIFYFKFFSIAINIKGDIKVYIHKKKNTHTTHI